MCNLTECGRDVEKWPLELSEKAEFLLQNLFWFGCGHSDMEIKAGAGGAGGSTSVRGPSWVRGYGFGFGAPSLFMACYTKVKRVSRVRVRCKTGQISKT